MLIMLKLYSTFILRENCVTAISVGIDLAPIFGGGQRNGPKQGKIKKNN